MMRKKSAVLLLCFWLALEGLVLAGEGEGEIPSIIRRRFNPNEVVSLEVAQRFVTLIRLPDKITEMVLGDPTQFQVEHSDTNIYVKPIVKEKAQTNLIVHTQGQQLINIYLRTQCEGSVSYPDKSGTHPRQLVYVLNYVAADRSFVIPIKSRDEVMAAALERAQIVLGDCGRLNTVGLSPMKTDKALLLGALFQAEEAASRVKFTGDAIQGAILKVTEQNNLAYIQFRLKNNTARVLTLLDPQVVLESTVRKGILRYRNKVGAADILPRKGLHLEKNRIAPGAEISGIIAVERPAALDSNQKMIFTVRESLKADKPLRLPIALGHAVLDSSE